MLKEIQAQLAEREVHTGGPVNHTDVRPPDGRQGLQAYSSGYLAALQGHDDVGRPAATFGFGKSSLTSTVRVFLSSMG